MKKILVLLTLMFLLTACGNTEPTEDPRLSTAEQFVEDIRQTADAMQETADFETQERATLVSWVATLAFQPTYTPYPTPIPSITPTATLAYDSCKADGGTWIRTTVKARLYTPKLNKAGTGLKVLNGKLIIVLVSTKDHTGINPGVTICAFERRQTDKGAAWGFWYQRTLGYMGDTYGYYLLASQVERIVVE